jgi:hypothetical protein
VNTGLEFGEGSPVDRLPLHESQALRWSDVVRCEGEVVVDVVELNVRAGAATAEGHPVVGVVGERVVMGDLALSQVVVVRPGRDEPAVLVDRCERGDRRAR